MGDDLNQHIYPRKKSRNWQFIIRTPADILKAYGGQKVHTRSTGTADKHAASLKASEWERALEMEWGALRKAASPSSTVKTLSDDEQAQFRAFVLDWRLDLDATARRTGEQRRRDPEGELSADEWVFIDEAVDDADDGKPAELNRLVRIALDRAGLSALPESEAFCKAREAYISAMSGAQRETSRRDREGFDFRTTAPTPAPKATSTTTAGHSLDDIRKLWERQANPKPRTKLEGETAAKRLNESTGGIPAEMIEKAHMRAFRDTQLNAGKARGTVLKYFGLLGSMFERAIEEDIIKVNPARGVKVPRPDRNALKPRVPLDLGDLQKLFSVGVYTERGGPNNDKDCARFWLPLLALWTGARQGELAQLLTADVRTHSGVTVIDITNEDDSADDTALTGTDGKSVKASTSKRRVPVHPELIACGFLDFVNAMKARGEADLFPALDPAPGRVRAAAFSQWFTRHRREHGITSKRTVFHSFRHGFKDAALECGIPGDRIKRLMGHGSGSDAHEGYGAAHTPVKPLAESMALLRYEGLDLSHLHRPEYAEKLK